MKPTPPSKADNLPITLMCVLVISMIFIGMIFLYGQNWSLTDFFATATLFILGSIFLPKVLNFFLRRKAERLYRQRHPEEIKPLTKAEKEQKLARKIFKNAWKLAGLTFLCLALFFVSIFLLLGGDPTGFGGSFIFCVGLMVSFFISICVSVGSFNSGCAKAGLIDPRCSCSLSTEHSMELHHTSSGIGPARGGMSEGFFEMGGSSIHRHI